MRHRHFQPRREYRFIAALCLALALALLVGLLNVPAGHHARVALASGALTETINAPVSVSATLTGLDQTVNTSLALNVVDTVGDGASWDLTITSTQFATSGGHTLPTSAASITAVSVACVGSCLYPNNATTYPVSVPAAPTAPTAVSFFQANTNTGSGSFTITATVAVNVLANAYAGVYTSTLTANVVAGVVPTGTPTPGVTLLTINTGGSLVIPYVADADYSGGNLSTFSSTTTTTTGVSNPPPAAVYQSEHWGGNFTYTLPGFIAGAVYIVRLHFAEVYFLTNGAGKRLFNVTINGTQVLTSFDVDATAGGAEIAIAESFYVTANTSGQIVIQFVAIKDNAKISAIQVCTTSC